MRGVKNWASELRSFPNDHSVGKARIDSLSFTTTSYCEERGKLSSEKGFSEPNPTVIDCGEEKDVEMSKTMPSLLLPMLLAGSHLSLTTVTWKWHLWADWVSGTESWMHRLWGNEPLPLWSLTCLVLESRYCRMSLVFTLWLHVFPSAAVT